MVSMASLYSCDSVTWQQRWAEKTTKALLVPCNDRGYQYPTSRLQVLCTQCTINAVVKYRPNEAIFEKKRTESKTKRGCCVQNKQTNKQRKLKRRDSE